MHIENRENFLSVTSFREKWTTTLVAFADIRINKQSRSRSAVVTIINNRFRASHNSRRAVKGLLLKMRRPGSCKSSSVTTRVQVRQTGKRIDTRRTRSSAAYLGYNGSHYFYRSDIHLPELWNYLLPSLPLPASIPLMLQSTCKNSGWGRRASFHCHLERPSASPNFSLKLRAIRRIYWTFTGIDLL